ncbi:MAG: NADH-quinone oxidoreductase subunit C [Acidaminococcaceae bacterium]
MKEEAMKSFSSEMALKLGNKFDLRWDIDKKGFVSGWCRLMDADDIYQVAEIVADFKGRVITLSALNTPSVLNEPSDASSKNEPIKLVINYHLYFDGINCTVTITLPDNERAVRSITPVLISADWHEREMQDLFNIKLLGHPNPKRLFLDKDIHLADHAMIPLSEAMNGAGTNTLWEKIMRSGRKDENTDEQL